MTAHPTRSPLALAVWGRRLRGWGIQIAILLAVFLLIQAWQGRHLTRSLPDTGPLTLSTGQTVQLADYRGRPLLIHFWATWCQICRLEQGSIDAVSRDYAVLTIASQSGSAADVQRYMDEHGLTFDAVTDRDGTLAQQFGISAFPTTFIISPTGNIEWSGVGYTTELALRARLRYAH